MVTFSQHSQENRWGRLGNMLFSLSCLVGYARKHNMPYVIPAWKYAQYFEGEFNQSLSIPEYPKWQETTYTYQEIPYMENIDIAGYFQSKKYFEHCEEEIRRMFIFKTEIQGRVKDQWWNVLSRNPVAIHVRRGDYVNLQQFYVLPTMEYYKQAMQMFPPDQWFIIFSDDVEWCRQNFTTGNVILSGMDEISDLCLMSMCKAGFIGANSSFSWWGSYLGQSEKIIFPKLWFNPNHETMNHSTETLYLPNWIVI